MNYPIGYKFEGSYSKNIYEVIGYNERDKYIVKVLVSKNVGRIKRTFSEDFLQRCKRITKVSLSFYR